MQEGTINRVFRSSFPEAEATGFRTNAWKFGVAESSEDLRPLHATLLHALATAAKLEDSTGITLLPERENKGEPQHLSYRAIYHKAANLSEELKRRGVQAGDCVMVVLPTSLDFVVVFFAIQMLGAIVVPAYPPAGLRMKAGLDRLGHIANHSGAKMCITADLVKPVMGELVLQAKGLESLITVEELGEGRAPETKARAKATDYAFIQYTSGSTGNPKGVLLTHKNLCSNIQAIGQALRINRDDVVVSWCPLYHDMGLIGTLLFAIYWRTPYVLMSPTSFLQKPSRWLRAIHDYRGTLSPAPNFGYGMCVSRVKPEEREGLDLSCWRMAMNGAEPVNYRTLVDFGDTYKEYGFDMNAFLPVYGLAEGTLAAAFPTPGGRVRYEVVDRQELANGRAVLASGKGSVAVVSVGSQVPGHKILIVDEDGAPLGEREVGHIVFAGDSVMSGYYEDKDATDLILKDGWLWTGDLGYMADNSLYVTGRAKDLIIIRGRNLYAEDIENVAERIEGVRPGGVVAFGIYDEEQKRDLVVVVAESKLEDSEEISQLAQAVSDRISEFCEVSPDEVVVVGPGTIPKTSSGKRQRARCKTLYVEGSLKPAQLGKLELGMVIARSKVGMLLLKAKGVFRGRG